MQMDARPLLCDETLITSVPSFAVRLCFPNQISPRELLDNAYPPEKKKSIFRTNVDHFNKKKININRDLLDGSMMRYLTGCLRTA